MKQGIGIDLSRRFFERLVAPLLESEFADLPVAAARIDLGSEVLVRARGAGLFESGDGRSPRSRAGFRKMISAL